MRVIVDEAMKKILRKLDRETRRKIGREINLYQNGHSVNFKKIATAVNTWRLAIDEWRILMRHDSATNIMRVVQIAQRKDAYR